MFSHIITRLYPCLTQAVCPHLGGLWLGRLPAEMGPGRSHRPFELHFIDTICVTSVLLHAKLHFLPLLRTLPSLLRVVRIVPAGIPGRRPPPRRPFKQKAIDLEMRETNSLLKKQNYVRTM